MFSPTNNFPNYMYKNNMNMKLSNNILGRYRNINYSKNIQRTSLPQNHNNMRSFSNPMKIKFTDFNSRKKKRSKPKMSFAKKSVSEAHKNGFTNYFNSVSKSQPKHILILKKWFINNLRYPYPSQKEKEKLRNQTKLSNEKIENWFSNARSRKWRNYFDRYHPSFFKEVEESNEEVVRKPENKYSINYILNNSSRSFTPCPQSWRLEKCNSEFGYYTVFTRK